MFGSKVIFVTFAIFAYCECYSVAFKKCDIGEDECQKDVYMKIIKESAESGIPAMGIPPFDPSEIDNLEIPVMGLIKIKIPEGTAKGLKSCDSTVFHQDMVNNVTTVELVCKLFTVDAKCIIETTPILDALIGGIKIHGEGNGGLKIENFKINAEIPFDMKKLDDGKLHVVIDPDEVTFTYEVLGKISVSLDNLYIGSQEVSAVAVNIINENWEFFAKSVGKTVFSTAVEMIFKCINRFFRAVPVSDLLNGDISAYSTDEMA